MSKHRIDTAELRKALDNLDTCRNAWGLLYGDGDRHGPWKTRSDGTPAVPPKLLLSNVIPDMDSDGAKHAQKCLDLAVAELMPQIIANAQKRASNGIDKYHADVEALAQGRRIS